MVAYRTLHGGGGSTGADALERFPSMPESLAFRRPLNRGGRFYNFDGKMLLIPARSNLDLFQIRVAGEAANALWGERIPGAAESVDDGVVVVEQAVAPMPLA